MADIKLTGLKKSFGAVDIIKGVDIDIKHGEFVVFVGPSGCGKSTLLRMIAGLEDISAGTLEIGGKRVNDLQPKERGVAMVFQSYAIFPHMTVRENVAFGLTIAGDSKEVKAAKVAKAAQILQMEHLLDRRPTQLSGGQRQRVAIGRAIVREPSVFLFDEPLSNLDAALRMDMRMEIGKLHKQLGATMIYVTHDQVEAMTLADKIVVLKEGRVMQTGAPMDLFHRPDNLFVAGFMGSPAMNFLDVDVRDVSGANVTVSNAALDPVTLTPRQTGFQTASQTGFKPGQRAKLGVRPHYLHPADAATPGRLHGKVALTERHGAETMLNITLNDGTTVIAALSQDAMFDIGTKVDLGFDPAQAHLFADDGTKGPKASH